MEQNKPTRPIVAVLLSLILPGLGHLYCGKPVRGVVCYIAFWAVLLVVGLSGLINSYSWLLSLAIIGLALQAIVATDAGIIAFRLREIPLNWYNRWHIYLAVIMAVHLVAEPVWVPIVQHGIVGLQTFKVPSNAMSPALIKGDYFIARSGAYSNRVPERSEIIVFPHPSDRTKTFVKRVIGLPGEQLYIKDKKVFINDTRLVDPWGVHTDEIVMPASAGERDNFGPITIPEDSVFVLGDNRDHSLDSRFWGCLPIRDIEGKALFVYRSNDPSRIDRRLD